LLGKPLSICWTLPNKFGFYYEYCSKEGLEQVHISEQRIKLIFPKMFLKVVKEHYWYYPLIRYIYHLFPLNAPVESLPSLGFRFKVIFASAHYVHCSLSRRLGELSLFHQSFAEDIVFNKGQCSVRTVPSLSSELKTKYSADEQSYSQNAWNDLYGKSLSEDGIFLPNKDNSCGPDILVRVSLPIDDDSSSSDEVCSSLTEMLKDTSAKKRRVYLIGITLKYCRNSSVNAGHD